MSRWTDLHNHLMPAVDDGARDDGEMREAIRALQDSGVASVVTTPHVDGSVTLDPARLRDRLAELDAAWNRLTEAAAELGLTDVGRATEVKLDVPRVDVSDPRLRLGGSRAVLVEFPFMSVPPRSEQVLMALRRDGHVPVLAHPERYQGVDRDLRTVERWLDAGAYLQVNAPSLTGRYGGSAQATAWELLSRGWAHCLASDYHSRGSVDLTEARAELERAAGAEQARLLFEENPSRLLADQDCLPVPPLPKMGGVKRLLARLAGR